jgi:hypothetical protein
MPNVILLSVAAPIMSATATGVHFFLLFLVEIKFLRFFSVQVFLGVEDQFSAPVFLSQHQLIAY